jgi:hypothetical protein
VSEAWAIVLAVGIGTVALKAAGPVLLGGHPLPERARALVALLAPALLAALVATNTVAVDQRLVLDARLLGVAVAAIAIALRAPVLVVVILAATVAALARLLAFG